MSADNTHGHHHNGVLLGSLCQRAASVASKRAFQCRCRQQSVSGSAAPFPSTFALQ